MPRNSSTRRRFLKLGGAALTAGLAGCSTAAPSSDTTGPSPAAETTRAGSRSDASAYTQVYRDTVSSVTLVNTDQGQGTGFIYDDTHVVTNAHVVGRASETQLRFHDGSWDRGTVEGTDANSDLAVISADTLPESTQPLPLVDQAPVIGQEVVAIGNPYNLDGTVTTGIVSGVDRLIPAPTGYSIPDAIQTDAAVNPGNSGGPLMSLDGEALGVVNSKRGDSIGFGISATLTRRVVSSLIDTGEYEHSYLGAQMENVTPTIAEANGLDDPQGLLIVQTASGGPADGVLQSSDIEFADGGRVPVGGDVIIAVEGTPIGSFEDLASYLTLQTRPGDTVRMTVLRDGTEQTVDLTLGSRPNRPRSRLR